MVENNKPPTDSAIQVIEAIKDIQQVRRDGGDVGIVDLLVLLAAVIACIGSILNNIKLGKSKTKDVSTRIKKEDIELDKTIEKYLDRMIGVTASTVEASKAIVTMYHNGETVGPFPFRFASVFWEATNDGVMSCKSRYQGIDFAVIRYEIEKGIDADGGFISYSHRDSLSEAYRLYLLENNSRFVIARLLGQSDSSKSGIINKLLGNIDKGYIGSINIHFPEIPTDEQIKSLYKELETPFLLLEGVIKNPYKSSS